MLVLTATNNTPRIAKNFPSTKVFVVIGFVNKISIVPVLNSSEKLFIVNTEVKIIINHGAALKKSERSL